MATTGQAEFSTDVAVIGIGRVGLPLALTLREAGYSVLGIDRDPDVVAKVASGKMPFLEPGFDELASVPLPATVDTARAATARVLIITVGTPLRSHIETDLDHVKALLQSLLEHLRPGHVLILRSTVAPGTTAFVQRYLELQTPLRVGKDLMLAFCPERIAEGKARTELKELPQIIGAMDEASRTAARSLFARTGVECLDTDWTSAELVKLFNNISRYVHFAVANQFALISDLYGTSIHDIIHLANHRYPRGIIATPGMTAGTCLRKDFGMVNEASPYPDLTLAAWKINEYMPYFLVSHLQRRISLHGKKVAVLGYTFKRDADDERDSLCPKLIRYIERETPVSLRVHEPNLPVGAMLRECGCVNQALPDALRDADVVFLGTNHSAFESAGRASALALLRPETWVVDIWNAWRANRMFFQVKDLAVDTGR